jgi:hypothetical protein
MTGVNHTSAATEYAAAVSRVIWRHKKRGTTYQVMTHFAALQCASDQETEDRFKDLNWTIYRSREDGAVYVRLTSEFMDGRFERIGEESVDLAQPPVRHLQCERCGEVAIASGVFCDDCAELSIGAAKPPAAPVETRADDISAMAALIRTAVYYANGSTLNDGEAVHDSIVNCLRSIFRDGAVSRSSAANGDALSIAETDREVMRQAIVEACDLLAERKYGNPARSPGHNARLVLERALSTGIPALPQEALRYAATKAVEAYRRAQSEGEVVIAMENLERALSPDEPRRSVTRPHQAGGEA